MEDKVYGEIRILSKDSGEYTFNGYPLGVCKYWGSVLQCRMPGGKPKGGISVPYDCAMSNPDKGVYQSFRVPLVYPEANPDAHEIAKKRIEYFYYSDLEGKDTWGLFTSDKRKETLYMALSKEDYDKLDIIECDQIEHEPPEKLELTEEEKLIEMRRQELLLQEFRRPESSHAEAIMPIGVIILIAIISIVSLYFFKKSYSNKNTKSSK